MCDFNEFCLAMRLDWFGCYGIMLNGFFVNGLLISNGNF